MPEVCVEMMWFMLDACFPLGSLEFCYVLGKIYLCGQPIINILGTEALVSFCGRHISHMLSQPIAGEVRVSCVTHRRVLKACGRPPLDLTLNAFSLC